VLLNTSVRVPGWLAGILAATCALIVLRLVSMGFYVSLGGLIVAGTIAFLAGTCMSGIFDPERLGRNTATVAFYLVVLAAAYFLILPALGDPVPPGARGGPGVFPPTGSGGPGVFPPR
jgi:hypothetical protein